MEGQCALYLPYNSQDLQLNGNTTHYNACSTLLLSIIYPDPPHANTILDPPILAHPIPDLSLSLLITRNLPDTPNHLQRPHSLPRAHGTHHTQTRPVHDRYGAAQWVIPLRRVLGVREREGCGR